MRLITPAQISSDAISASVTAHPSIESANQPLVFNSRFLLLCVVTEISPLRCGFFVRRFFKLKCRARIPLVDFLQSSSWNFAEGSGVLPRGEDRPACVEAKRGSILRWVGQQQRSSGRQATAIAIDRALAGFVLVPLTNFSLKNKKPAYQIQLWPAGFVSVKKCRLIYSDRTPASAMAFLQHATVTVGNLCQSIPKSYASISSPSRNAPI
jgi:hypothetical protein